MAYIEVPSFSSKPKYANIVSFGLYIGISSSYTYFGVSIGNSRGCYVKSANNYYRFFCANTETMNGYYGQSASSSVANLSSSSATIDSTKYYYVSTAWGSSVSVDLNQQIPVCEVPYNAGASNDITDVIRFLYGSTPSTEYPIEYVMTHVNAQGPTSAAIGQDVVVTLTPNDGYKLTSVTVEDEAGPVPFIHNDNSIAFVMPGPIDA